MGANHGERAVVMNWTEFFHMGGYAFYVWSAWGLSSAVLLWLYLQPKLTNKKIINDIARQIAREDRQT
jgi:heme exporter protein D